MPQFDSTNVITLLKAYSRSNPLPIDSTMVQDSIASATTYASAANAYAGQILSVLDTDTNTYKIYILQPGEGGYTLTEYKSGSDEAEFEYVKVVSELPGSGMVEGCLYINTTDKTGSIYDGSEFVQVFKDVSTDITSVEGRLDTVEAGLAEKAPINNPTFTGVVTLAQNPTNPLEAAPKQYVDQLIANIQSFEPGVVNASTPLPSTDYKAGQTWRVAEAGTYAGQTCEVGDLIICVKDYESAQSDADFIVVQANIDGAVTSSADAVTDLNIVVFDGTTGKIIKDSNVSISSLNTAIANSHTHANKDILDTYTQNQTDLLASAQQTAKTYTDGQVATLQEAIDDKANSADVYTKTDIDGKVSTLQTAIDGKVSTTDMQEYVTTQINNVTGGDTVDFTMSDIEKYLGFGDITGEPGQTVKQYIDTAVGSGGTDASEAIAEALAQAKAYTDEQLAIKTF